MLSALRFSRVFLEKAGVVDGYVSYQLPVNLH